MHCIFDRYFLYIYIYIYLFIYFYVNFSYILDSSVERNMQPAAFTAVISFR
jgi:hypothetical protein